MKISKIGAHMTSCHMVQVQNVGHMITINGVFSNAIFHGSVISEYFLKNISFRIEAKMDST